MGIYLGQLPPAEIARLKAELAETLIANFCYPRFFDHRTESLQMRPVDRNKRQEVWLYLSSVDFTAWNRVDLMSADIQHQIERLFIQFVQRNRNFFGEQGRRRMSDIRLLINSCASSVVQAWRNHLSGQKAADGHLFGSPHTVVSWSTPSISQRAELTWEQIAPATMLLQQHLQELRGEVKLGDAKVAPAAATAIHGTTGMARREAPAAATRPATGRPNQGEPEPSVVRKPVTPVGPRPVSAPLQANTPAAVQQAAFSSAAAAAPAVQRTAQRVDTTPKPPTPAQPYDTRTVAPVNRNAPLVDAPAVPVAPISPALDTPMAASAPTAVPTKSASSTDHGTMRSSRSPFGGDTAPTSTVTPASAQRMPPPMVPPASLTSSATSDITNGPREMMSVGEDDVAIFEQMRHQLIIWLRIEAVTAGLEITSQSPTQLLEMLREQARFDETRLQVVSTLLNLANQVIKTGLVSVLDYKQALMFHLMHTRRQ
ncbi:hypothetical protein [Dictyobacter arantiisoli]|uniref:Uncharacterized protein n=1 Tax=Dictyobacter arantiisoli TaxID=2014874 RepID=A0A5A5TA67_9CHLR|nr:hypothetical protein [Dictyobacter arantiisoli]GCF07869.1 hypothetical protein KDI_14330 [Dictyobacter arantiisoli]